MSSTKKIDNREKKISQFFVKVLHKDQKTHCLQKKKHSINFTEHNKAFCFNLHYNGANSYSFVNGKEIHKFNTNNYEIVATQKTGQKII